MGGRDVAAFRDPNPPHALDLFAAANTLLTTLEGATAVSRDGNSARRAWLSLALSPDILTCFLPSAAAAAVAEMKDEENEAEGGMAAVSSVSVFLVAVAVE